MPEDSGMEADGQRFCLYRLPPSSPFLLSLSRLPAQPSSQIRFGGRLHFPGKVFCGLFIYTFYGQSTDFC